MILRHRDWLVFPIPIKCCDRVMNNQTRPAIRPASAFIRDRVQDGANLVISNLSPGSTSHAPASKICPARSRIPVSELYGEIESAAAGGGQASYT